MESINKVLCNHFKLEGVAIIIINLLKPILDWVDNKVLTSKLRVAILWCFWIYSADKWVKWVLFSPNLGGILLLLECPFLDILAIRILRGGKFLVPSQWGVKFCPPFDKKKEGTRHFSVYLLNEKEVRFRDLTCII